jgi:t-SNARE complex subunit (syntaxin)
MSPTFSCHVTNFLKTWRNGISTRNNDDRKYPLLQIIVAIIIVVVVVVMILSCFHVTPAH